MEKHRKQKQKRITFVASKVGKNPPVVRFYEENGKEVYFKNKKYFPESVKEFF